ncbi:uncharacterized protein C9orf57 homolog [Elgaria multicarinata webbii]|uniref:uncharacterized protein C9orf57 homolog n=1 Tax=Elgaria multicarinata webbii TaxID=159646 RepID=UPI002FCD65DA
MNKFLLLSISILLCSVLAEARTCYQCSNYKIGVGCKSPGLKYCTAEPGQQCKTITSFRGNLQHFIGQGCTQLNEVCGSTQFSEELGSFTTNCCNSHDYCNSI